MKKHPMKSKFFPRLLLFIVSRFAILAVIILGFTDQDISRYSKATDSFFYKKLATLLAIR